jgi:hypothetical protein
VIDKGITGGLAWSADDICVDGGRIGSIQSDGSFEMVMPLDTLKGELGVAWPTALPEGRGILVRVRRQGDAESDYTIVMVDTRRGTRKQVVRGVFASYSSTGHLLWVTADGALHAQRFDLDRAELLGAPVVMLNGLGVRGLGATDLALSPLGDLLYVPAAARTGVSDLAWVTRAGTRSRADTTAVDGIVNAMALSPDGSAVALELARSRTPGKVQIWVKLPGGG